MGCHFRWTKRAGRSHHSDLSLRYTPVTDNRATVYNLGRIDGQFVIDRSTFAVLGQAKQVICSIPSGKLLAGGPGISEQVVGNRQRVAPLGEHADETINTPF